MLWIAIASGDHEPERARRRRMPRRRPRPRRTSARSSPRRGAHPGARPLRAASRRRPSGRCTSQRRATTTNASPASAPASARTAPSSRASSASAAVAANITPAATASAGPSHRAEPRPRPTNGSAPSPVARAVPRATRPTTAGVTRRPAPFRRDAGRSSARPGAVLIESRCRSNVDLGDVADTDVDGSAAEEADPDDEHRRDLAAIRTLEAQPFDDADAPIGREHVETRAVAGLEARCRPARCRWSRSAPFRRMRGQVRVGVGAVQYGRHMQAGVRDRRAERAECKERRRAPNPRPPSIGLRTFSPRKSA